MKNANVVKAVPCQIASNFGRFSKALDSLSEVALFCVVAAYEEVAVGGFVGIWSEEGDDDFGV